MKCAPLPNYHMIVEWRCETCGTFLTNPITESVLRERQANVDDDAAMKLSCLMRLRMIHGQQPCLIGGPNESLEQFEAAPVHRVDELLSNWPAGALELLDQVVVNLGRMNREIGVPLVFPGNSARPVLMARTVQEMMGILVLLEQQGIVSRDGSTLNTMALSLTADGWKRFKELTQSRPDPKLHPVFVAMWFNSEMAKAYTEGIAPAVSRAGYMVQRVDDEPHTEYIMEKMLGMIRVAPFVVADFTGHRNGVYYEAGFARGLGRQVFACCRADEFDKAHFDTKQLNHLLWNNPADLQEKLLCWIRGSIGLGPHSAEV